MKRFFLILILVLFMSFVAYYFIAGYHYSEGERSGILRKFSKKGFLFKTYEGELMNGGCKNYTNIQDKVFLFSGDKSHPEVIDSLNAWNGRCVSLHYYEVISNFSWEGDSKYFVDKVKLETN